jgi:hypothetical protein
LIRLTPSPSAKAREKIFGRQGKDVRSPLRETA